MGVDVTEYLRPPQPPPPSFVDVEDIRRRVRRRRRTRALTVAAVLVFAVPLAVTRLPQQTTGVTFAPPAAGTGPRNNASPGPAPAGASSIAAVLARFDVAFTDTPPGPRAVSKARAVQAALDRIGDKAGARTLIVRHGVVNDANAPGRRPQAVWAVRLTQHVVQRGRPSGEPAPGVTVVLVDAATGTATMSVSTARTPDGHQQESVEAQLGAGSTGGQPQAPRAVRVARGATPRLAAASAARSLGRVDVRVRTVVFVAPTATRVLIEDATGCWVYAATDPDRDGTWEASGGEMPCDP